MIIKYKIFEDSESFEKYQQENDIKIFNISPIIGGMDMSAISSNKNTAIESKLMVFVTYSINNQ